MSKYKAIYDKQGKAYEYLDGELVWVREDIEIAAKERSAAIIGDAADFISPIDGTLVRGRRGLRDHCARHNVVPTVELAGLPPKPMVRHDYDPKYREETKRTIAAIINSRNYPRK